MIATLSTGAAAVVFDAASEDEDATTVDVALAGDAHVHRPACLVRPPLLTGENAQDDSAASRNTSRRENSSGVMARGEEQRTIARMKFMGEGVVW
jgi:hypothetical protein